jgi:hypothetical protein
MEGNLKYFDLRKLGFGIVFFFKGGGWLVGWLVVCLFVCLFVVVCGGWDWW